MATIITRAGKGSPLENAEVDANFTNLNTDKIESGDTVASLTITSADINGGTIDGVTIGGSSAGAITGTTITGTSFVTSGDMTFGDNDKAIFGAGSDLQIYHDGLNSYVDEQGSGGLLIRGTNLNLTDSAGVKFLRGESGGPTRFYHQGTEVLTSTSTGIDVTGTVTADGLTVDGNIDASYTGDSTTSVRTSHDGTTGLIASANFGTGYTDLDIEGKDVFIKRGIFSSVDAVKIEGSTGDISFYEDTGTTAKFFWDASAESLGIGGTVPASTSKLQVFSGADGRSVFRHAGGDGGITVAGSGVSSAANIVLGNNWTDDSGTGFTEEWRIALDGSSDSLQFKYNANANEAMRIDSSGNLLVGTTSTSIPNANSNAFLLGNLVNAHISGSASGSAYAIFGYAGSGIGSITQNGTTGVAYNTSSDYRLKEDWQPMSGSIDRLKALNPVNFAWKVDGSRVDGFLAHEAAEVVPEAVSGEKDAVEAIGNITDAEGTVVQENVTEPEELAEGQTWTKTEDRPVYQGIDQAKLVPLLTAALQEAVSKIEALETRITALEA